MSHRNELWVRIGAFPRWFEPCCATGAMHALPRWRQFTAPLVTAGVLIVLAGAFWGPQSGSSATPAVGQIARTRAQLSNGAGCEFAADVQLTSRWSSFAFSMRKEAIRQAFVALLRTKSEYMVDSRTSREALRYQMLDVVNSLIGSGRATDLCFTAFELL